MTYIWAYMREEIMSNTWACMRGRLRAGGCVRSVDEESDEDRELLLNLGHSELPCHCARVEVAVGLAPRTLIPARACNRGDHESHNMNMCACGRLRLRAGGKCAYSAMSDPS